MSYRGGTNKKILKNYLESKIRATWPLFSRKGIFEKMGLEHHQRVSNCVSTFSNSSWILFNVSCERSKRFQFILKAPAKALEICGFWGAEFLGSIIFSTVRILFSSRLLTFHICLVVRSNRAILFLFAFLVMLLTWIDISASWEIKENLVMLEKERDGEWSYKASNNRRSGNEPHQRRETAGWRARLERFGKVIEIFCIVNSFSVLWASLWEFVLK